MITREMQQEAHQMARSKGWWPQLDTKDEGQRRGLLQLGIPEKIALLHSEVSEATEAWGLGLPPVYTENNGKPEGLVVELADYVIRAMDLAGACGWDLTDDEVPIQIPHMPGIDSLGIIAGGLHRIHYYTSAALEDYRGSQGMPSYLFWADIRMGVWYCYRIAAHLELDLTEVIRSKMAYNATRPHRHGGKRA